MIVGAERLAVDVADAQALKARAASGDPDALRSAARQFESMLVAQMLKTMRETRFSEEDDPMTGGDGMKVYRELLDQQWAAKLTAGRGLGFAEMMVNAMQSRGMSAAAPQPGPTVQPPGMEAPQAYAATLAAPNTPRAAPLPVHAAGSAPDNTGGGDRKQAFLETMRPHADAAAAATGVPSRYILAHAALESGWGAREIRGEAGESSHNLFGIKTGRDWDGASVRTLTTEYRQGMPMKLAQDFRAYDDYGAGFTDYARLLKSRYGAALNGDAEAFARGISAGGYATDPAYAGKLKSVIATVARAGV